MKVLIVVAHPDDEILGMGGTLLKHQNSGDEIFIHILTDGHSSRLNETTTTKKNSEPIKRRLESARYVAKQLGAIKIHIDSFKDQMLDNYPLIKIVKAIEFFSKEIDPDIVYTHFGGDVNMDHRITFLAVLTAFRPVNKNTPSKILCAEIPSSTEWGDIKFNPNYFVDISDFLDSKTKLLSCYDYEMKEFPHPRSIEAIKNHSYNCGSVISAKAAEAFFLIREIWK